jgi:Ca2+-binding EF-hand superfamily protein/diadenosine tetraphosphatase ApaH/serine/threonine PP2A family protein phosphatase
MTTSILRSSIRNASSILQNFNNSGCTSSSTTTRRRHATAALVLAATATTGVAIIAVEPGSLPRPQRVDCESLQDSSSHQFKVHAAMELQTEMQKVRLAQVMHDLHQLARERTGGAGGGLDSMSALARRVTERVKAVVSHRANSSETDGVDLRGVELDSLDQDTAEQVIQAIRHGKALSAESLVLLMEASTRQLLQEPTVIDVTGRKSVSVVGDLHGSLPCLHNALKIAPPGRDGLVVVFDGDFVDRGDQSVEVLCTLLILKLAHPKHVYLLRGNHEDSLVAAAYGFRDEVEKKFHGWKEQSLLWDKICRVFAALPLCARTDTAMILHGGLPSADFDLSQLAEVSAADRSKLETVIEPHSDAEQLFADVLWSDPSAKHSQMRDNAFRGIGKTFGTDVAASVLKRHGLLYLVRGHEVMEQGVDALACGPECEIVTIFSSASYPNGLGSNLGAVLNLDSSGSYSSVAYSYEQALHLRSERSLDAICIVRNLIKSNKSKLEQALVAASDNNGRVSINQWCAIMGATLELDDLPWSVLQPELSSAVDDMIDCREFLDRYGVRLASGAALAGGSDQVEILHENHDALMTVFRYLDVDRNGSIDKEEFRVGLGVLNKRLPRDRQLQNVDELFQALDLDGNGVIDINEFERIFTVL